jgi:hypothetical protein
MKSSSAYLGEARFFLGGIMFELGNWLGLERVVVVNI